MFDQCMDILIRQERASDRRAVDSLVLESFKSARHSDGNEHVLVARLRGSNAFIPELSLVATVGNEIVGHIMFTKIAIDGRTHLALAPLAVLPEWRCKRIGSALVREGHAVAQKLGYGMSVVLGDYDYYSRFGYRPASLFGIRPPMGVDEKYYMAFELNPTDGFVTGYVAYAEPFGL